MQESRGQRSFAPSAEDERGSRDTILLVEDETIIALMERRLLERAGYRVLSARTGEEAVRAGLLDPSIDLILMDIDLGPGLSGIDAAERILAERRVPIVFLSADSSEGVRSRANDLSPGGFIEKGTPTKKILASIQCRVARGRGEGTRTLAP